MDLAKESSWGVWWVEGEWEGRWESLGGDLGEWWELRLGEGMGAGLGE